MGVHRGKLNILPRAPLDTEIPLIDEHLWSVLTELARSIKVLPAHEWKEAATLGGIYLSVGLDVASLHVFIIDREVIIAKRWSSTDVPLRLKSDWLWIHDRRKSNALVCDSIGVKLRRGFLLGVR